MFVRYTNKTTGRRDTASYPSISPTRPVESPKDITDRGPLTPAEATTIAAGLWAEHNSGRAGWTNGLRLASGQVTNLGGTVADLAFIRAPKAMALRSVPDPRGVSRNTSIVIGDYEFDWATGELQANPKGLAAQDEQSALDSVAELAVSAVARASAGAPGRVIPAISVYKVSGQSLTANTTSIIVMDTIRGGLSAASGGMVLDPAGTVTVPIGGWYQVNGNVTFASSAAANRRFVWIGTGPTSGTMTSVHEVSILASAQDTASISALDVSAVVRLEAGQAVSVAAQATTNWGLDVSSPYMNALTVAYLGAA